MTTLPHIGLEHQIRATSLALTDAFVAGGIDSPEYVRLLGDYYALVAQDSRERSAAYEAAALVAEPVPCSMTDLPMTHRCKHCSCFERT